LQRGEEKTPGGGRSATSLLLRKVIHVRKRRTEKLGGFQQHGNYRTYHADGRESLVLFLTSSGRAGKKDAEKSGPDLRVSEEGEKKFLKKKEKEEA